MITFEKVSVTVDQARYDELVRKEAMLEAIVKLHGKLSDYVFRDAVGFLLKSDVGEANE